MISVDARMLTGPGERFVPTTVLRRDLGPRDVLIDIAFTGICHSDIAYANDEWGTTPFPLVPGHEIAGTIEAIGTEVTKFAVGDRAGVGCMSDSCRECDDCLEGLEQFCTGDKTMTYNGVGRDGQPTYGGYSKKIVVDEDFVIRIPDSMDLQSAAPLFCAGVTVYSPMRHWGVGPGSRVAIMGFGGVGHVATQIAAALGAEPTVLDLSMEKKEDGLRLGAVDYRSTLDPTTLTDLAGAFDLVLCTVPVTIDLHDYINLLARDGTFVTIGIPAKPLEVSALSMVMRRRSIAGTRFGSIAETQEMIDFCATHGLGAMVETVSADQIDDAFERIKKGDVRYRFVIDASTLADS